MKLVLGVCVAVLLAACVDRQPTVAQFSVDEVAFIKKPGKGVVVGHAFLTKSTGVVVNAAGQVVRLIPATPFSRERFAQLYGKGKYVPHSAYPRDDNPDPRYGEYSRTTKAEANGKFAFENVPPGEYFITTQVLWGDEDALFRQGGSIYETVTLTGKETEPVQVVLSRY